MNGYRHINLNYLESMSHGDVSVKKTLLEMLLKELEVEIPKMKHLINRQDWSELRETSHKMKTTLPFVGNNTMVDANLEIETRAKHKEQLEDVHQYQEVLERLCPEVLNELKKEYAKLA
jgi:HPt (histidine-containing phosphotransfer) domain-containing protein